MDLGIKGKTAFVGGSSSGLGEAVAKSLAAEGVDIILSSTNEQKLNRVKDEINQKYRVKVLTLAGDFTKAEDIRSIANKSLEAFGKVDILFTNTGGPVSCLFEDTTDEMWETSFRGLLMSTVQLTKAFLPGMKAQGWGRIINSTSIAVKQPVNNLVLSNSVRASVTGLSKTLSNEVAEFGITVNCVLPGYTLTQRIEYLARKAMEIESITYEQAIAKWTGEIPMKRIGTPKEFADVVTFLASERASYITGQSVVVDGGWVRNLL